MTSGAGLVHAQRMNHLGDNGWKVWQNDDHAMQPVQGFSCQRADFRTMPFKNDTLYRKNENSPVELISDDLSWANETNLEVIFEGQKQVKIGIPVLCRFGKILLMKDNNFSPHNSEGKQLHLAVGLYEIWHPNYFWFLLNKWAQLQLNWCGR